MKDLMVIETRDPTEVADTSWGAALVRGAARAGAKSCLMLVENGVLAARSGAQAPCLDPLIGDGAMILADRFALAERGIAEADLKSGIAAAELDSVLDWADAGATLIWR